MKLNSLKPLSSVDVLCTLLPLAALIVWSISLRSVDVRQMNDLGLISVLPASIIIALLMLNVSFCLGLRQQRLRTPLLLLHLILLIFMLYAITTLVEEAPRFNIVYRHAGFTEYIMRTGSIDPNLDAYFNWPGFFILSAFVTRITGYQDILGFAAWAPVFFNLIYLGPLYMIFTSATTDKRLVWLGLWFFYLTNWIGQDYFAPQALNFFLYLVIIAILLNWFREAPGRQPGVRGQQQQRLSRVLPFARRLHAWLTRPDTPLAPTQPKQRMALLVILIVIFALVVFSHPLTPFFVLASVTALVIFRRCTPRWLPILMAAMTGAWIFFMARTYLSGHLSDITGSLGQLSSILTENVTNRAVEGSPEHNLIAAIRIIMTVLVWGLACLGGIRRLRKGYGDATYVLLAVAPFLLLVAQPYGGEMLLRIYLFTLPMMVFFAAAIFYTPSTSSRFSILAGESRSAEDAVLCRDVGLPHISSPKIPLKDVDPSSISGASSRITLAVAITSILLLGGFLFTRYGNENMDYMTSAEVNGMRYLYSIVQPNSLLIEGWDGTPWKFENYEKYTYYSMSDELSEAVRTHNVDSIIQYIEKAKHPATYLIFSRSEKATAELLAGLPFGTLDRLEQALLGSEEFKMLYNTPDIQIFTFISVAKGGTSCDYPGCGLCLSSFLL